MAGSAVAVKHDPRRPDRSRPTTESGAALLPPPRDRWLDRVRRLHGSDEAFPPIRWHLGRGPSVGERFVQLPHGVGPLSPRAVAGGERDVQGLRCRELDAVDQSGRPGGTSQCPGRRGRGGQHRRNQPEVARIPRFDRDHRRGWHPPPAGIGNRLDDLGLGGHEHLRSEAVGQPTAKRRLGRLDRALVDDRPLEATTGHTVGGTTPPFVPGRVDHADGVEYVAPLTVTGTTTLRAMAFKQGLLSSNVDTQTYLFTNDIAQQTQQATIAAGFPSSWGGRGADYGIDPDVVGPNDLFGGVYTASFADDLKTLPALSLVMDVDDMFGPAGIYANINSRGQAWERPVSAELIYPDGQEGFQVDAGVRIHGGASRSLSRKNNLRLLFKEQYGPTKLDFPLFGDGVDHFDTIVLRAHFNDGWGWDGAGGDPLFARDEWHRQTQAAMGHIAPRGIGVHLYINGIYWGLYNPSERPDASFAAQHLGGDKTDWDSINHGGVVDGNSSAWNTMRSMAAAVDSASGAAAKWAAYQALQGNDPDGNDDPLREDYLDVENYIDYLMLSFYSGNDDWPGNNWFAARRRGAESEGFQFFAWDSEISMNLSGRTHLNENVINDANNGPDGAAAAYGSLRNYEEFQLAFADRVHQHFFNGGVFYVDPDDPAWDPARPERNVPAARMVAITDVVSDAVVAESARWGDQHRNPPYTRDAEWQGELDDLLTVFFPQRTGIVMGQLRAHNLYPDTDAPEFEIDGVRQHGGTVASGALLGFENPNNGQGTIWFTSDGSDPRLPGGAVNVASAVEFTGQFPLNTSGTLKARILNGGQWSALSEATFVFDQSGLRIAEVHYHPAEPSKAELAVDPDFNADDFEFIELVNVSHAHH